MKDYIKPYLEEEEIELDDVIAASNDMDMDKDFTNGDDDF